MLATKSLFVFWADFCFISLLSQTTICEEFVVVNFFQHENMCCKSLGPSHTKDPWDFAGDTGSNAYFGTVERMKLGQFWA